MRYKIILFIGIMVLLSAIFLPSKILATDRGTLVASVFVYDPNGPSLGITVVPEKRVVGGMPGTDRNLSSLVRVWIFPPMTARTIGYTVFSTTTNSNDTAQMLLVANGLESGTYDIAIKAKTCLTRVAYGVSIDRFTDFDITENGTNPLLCGDINSDFGDDKVNAIDVSLLVDNWSTSDENADLNRDGLVNSIDISNMLANFNSVGE